VRAATGATLVAVCRGRELLLNPGPDLRLQADDVAGLIGDQSQVERALTLLDPACGEEPPPDEAATS